MLSVGVTGHRPNKLHDANLPVLRSTIGSALRTIQEPSLPLAEHRPADGRIIFRIVSALAEGADRIVAEEALTLGYELEAVLPYPAEEHAAEFSAASYLEFRRLLSSATATLILSGRPRDPAAYHAAGLALLQQSDVLLAVWDGEPASGHGGTAEIVAAAGERQMPVVHVDSRAPHRVRLWQSPNGIQVASDGLAQLPQALSRILGTPPPRPA